MIIDATDTILGRLGSYVAQKVLKGERVDIVNCEKAVVSGRKAFVLDRYKHNKDRGTYKGPFIPKPPQMFVKRVIRGMLPYKSERGRAAFANIRCHVGVPAEMKDKKIETLKEANVSKLPTLDYVTVKEICKKLGAKIE